MTYKFAWLLSGHFASFFNFEALLFCLHLIKIRIINRFRQISNLLLLLWIYWHKMNYLWPNFVPKIVFLCKSFLIVHQIKYQRSLNVKKSGKRILSKRPDLLFLVVSETDAVRIVDKSVSGRGFGPSSKIDVNRYNVLKMHFPF